MNGIGARRHFSRFVRARPRPRERPAWREQRGGASLELEPDNGPRPFSSPSSSVSTSFSCLHNLPANDGYESRFLPSRLDLGPDQVGGLKARRHGAASAVVSSMADKDKPRSWDSRDCRPRRPRPWPPPRWRRRPPRPLQAPRRGDHTRRHASRRRGSRRRPRTPDLSSRARRTSR